MSNNYSNIFYKQLSQKISKDDDLKFGSDFSEIDAKFIISTVQNRVNLLDIGSGTGLIVNRLVSHFENIHCVEPFEEFSKYIKNAENVTIHKISWFDFQAPHLFDAITIFGVAHYFNEPEITLLYGNTYEYCSSGGVLIIKNQFAKTETKEVHGSEQLGPNYYAQYRTVKTELNVLENCGFIVVGVFDMYENIHNKWPDTHYKAIVVAKK